MTGQAKVGISKPKEITESAACSAKDKRSLRITDEQLTAMLAERIMGWNSCPDRFIKSGRSWIPKWRFSPFTRIEDAFSLLDKAGGTYALAVDVKGVFTAQIRIGDCVGRASGDPKARSITLAIARALCPEDLQ